MAERQHLTNETVDAAAAGASAEPIRARPRVWTVFVDLLVALVGTVGIQVVIVAALVAWRVADGMDVHITPHSIANAFVIGLWLGVLAWRTGSVLPGMMCHAFINGAWNIWQIGKQLGGIPETQSTPVVVCGGAIVVACFLLSIWIIARRNRRS